MPLTPRTADDGSSDRTASIVVRGEFGPRLARTFRGCDVTMGGGTTQIGVQRETDLNSVLDRLEDLGATLLSLSVEENGTA